MLIEKPNQTLEHRNPELKTGRTYILIQESEGNYTYCKGRVFVCGGSKIVWLATETYNGGWDSVGTLERRQMKFAEVDLQVL